MVGSSVCLPAACPMALCHDDLLWPIQGKVGVEPSSLAVLPMMLPLRAAPQFRPLSDPHDKFRQVAVLNVQKSTGVMMR